MLNESGMLRAIVVMMWVLVACGSDSTNRESSTTIMTVTGGLSSGGGVQASGGSLATGGSALSGGSLATGGLAITGGALVTGGTTVTGGVATGGVIATGGNSTTGGVVATGGMTTGGVIATGGTGDPVTTSGCGNASSPGSGTFTLNVDGTDRTYIVASPSGYDENHPYTLIFAWHYLGGSASGIANSGYYGMESKSAGTAVLVSPEGINAGWANSGGQDVAFARAMLDWMKSNYCIDESRIFSVGFSYGAIMSNTVGCQLGDQFRAIAPMSGSGPSTFGGTTCVGQVAAWISHGDSDTTVSFSSGQSSRDHWVAANHCASTTTTVGNCVAYDGCDAGYPVHWCQFSGGHMTPPWDEATDIWAFFSQF